jgi:hypothetical protein
MPIAFKGTSPEELAEKLREELRKELTSGDAAVSKLFSVILRAELDKPLGTPVDEYSGAVSLSATTWTDLKSYTVPTGKKLLLCEFGGFSTVDFQIKLLIDATEKRVIGNLAKANAQYVFVNPVEVAAGTVVKVQGYVASAADCYGWLNGYTVSV